MRDPAALGTMLLAGHRRSTRTLSDYYDHNRSTLVNDCPDYTGFLSGYYTAKEYIAELEGREDRYAKSTLADIKNGNKNKNAEIV